MVLRKIYIFYNFLKKLITNKINKWRLEVKKINNKKTSNII